MGGLFSPNIPTAPVNAAAPTTTNATSSPGSLEMPTPDLIGAGQQKKKKFKSDFTGLQIPPTQIGAV